MGEAKRRQKLDPAFGQPKPSRVQNIETGLELAAQRLLVEGRAEAQAPFDAYSYDWVCSFGNENIAVDTLEKCLDWIEVEGSERKQVRQECLFEGYVEADHWDIQ
ncbi:hypothetical protein H6F90_11875 [Trichocoleus sp. FACHB-591]|uniref:hypothetical protein n=1 Tax=Trichocoleus sp. FACHB-591 TaxID=2692872 RepID=UPI001681C620|nr:hypothetical protein [Trichocoleus sp. FACHB-591]MBD2095847.1 hypothetical protein [Trichocoleus sp. FACHB-591]